jgi:adenosylcobinamide-phosphate synthase
VVDRVAGEPPARLHPVALFGRLMEAFERRRYADARSGGALYATTGFALGFAAGSVCPLAVVVACTTAGRELRRVASEVRDALASGELEQARSRVTALVGRDPSALDPSDLAAAVIESLAENTVDAVVAPVWWAVVGGRGAAAAYRAVNTMDAMVGHRSPRYEHFGWASARLDDAANYVPARLTAALVALVRPASGPAVRRALRTQAPEHPSPNAGVAEAAFAAVLGVELGGPLRYGDHDEERPWLGWGPRPTVADIDRALTLASHVELALLGLLVAIFLGARPR